MMLIKNCIFFFSFESSFPIFIKLVKYLLDICNVYVMRQVVLAFWVFFFFSFLFSVYSSHSFLGFPLHCSARSGWWNTSCWREHVPIAHYPVKATKKKPQSKPPDLKRWLTVRINMILLYRPTKTVVFLKIEVIFK